MFSRLAENIVNAAALADELARCRILEPERGRALLAEFSGSNPMAFAEFLVRRSALSYFQAARALSGEANALSFGPYRLTAAAGSGTFGSLYAATHTSKPGMFVARVQPLRSLWQARKAKQLVRAIAAVKHPAVNSLLEVDSANGIHYLIWPHLEGERLADRINERGPMTPGDVVAMLGHLAHALATCHAAGVAHGAIAPHCVYLAPNGMPYLHELGAGALFAQNLEGDESLFDSMSAAFASAAILPFAAPELAATGMTPTPVADQYALGAVGYFALTGLRPYPHPGLAEQLRAKRFDPPPSAAIVNPDVPPELAEVIEKLMSPDPAVRFTSLDVLEEKLGALPLSELLPIARTIPPMELLARLRDAREPGGLLPRNMGNAEGAVLYELPEAIEVVSELKSKPAPIAVPSQATVETPLRLPYPNRVEYPSSASPQEQVARSESAGSVTRYPNARNKGSESTPPPDPRKSAPVLGLWEPKPNPEKLLKSLSSSTTSLPAPVPTTTDRPPGDSPLWKKLVRTLLFWRTARDPVQVSVFGPLAAKPGQTVKLLVCLHTPDALANVRTLSRVFQPDVELLGTGYLLREVPHAIELAVHLAVANTNVDSTLMKFVWSGQPNRFEYDLHVPWECAEGVSPGLVSVGMNDVRVGKIEFNLNVLSRRA